MSTRNDLIAMSGTLGSRPTDWTNVSGDSVLIVADETDPRVQAILAPRTGATMFGYDNRTGSGTEVDEFQRDFNDWELTAIAAGNADYTFQIYGGKDSTDLDEQRVGIEFFNVSNVSLGTAVYTTNLDYTQGEWNLVTSGPHVIPTTATYVKIYLEATSRFSSALNCFWDDATDLVRIVDPDASFTPQFAGLAVYSDGAGGVNSGIGSFTPQFAALAVIQVTDPGDWTGSSQFAGLAVIEDGPSPTEGPFSSQLLGQVVWGQNVREQLNVRSWGFEFDGHEFVVYSLGAQGTYGL